MADFGKILKNLRIENGYSLESLAKTYNERFGGRLNKSTISRYENGLQEPIITVVSNFARLFDVSSDYLLGNVSEPFFRLDNARILREVNSPRPDDATDDYSLVTIHYAGPVAAHFDATPDDAYEQPSLPSGLGGADLKISFWPRSAATVCTRSSRTAMKSCACDAATWAFPAGSALCCWAAMRPLLSVSNIGQARIGLISFPSTRNSSRGVSKV